MKIDPDFLERVLSAAKGLGADEGEVFAVDSRNLSVEVKRGDVESLEKSIDAGYCVRVIRDRREGFSYSTDFNDFRSCVEKSLETAKWAERDDYVGMPDDGPMSNVAVFDPALDALSDEQAKGLALEVEEAALTTDSRITKTRKTSVNVSVGSVHILNTRGIAKSFSSTFINSHIMVVAEDGKDSQTGWDYQGSRFLDDITFPGIGRGAAQRALQLLGAEKGRPAKGNVILDNAVAAEFIGIFAAALSAESVQKGKSLLSGKTGQQVIADGIDIVDNALIDRLEGSRPFDAEGVATQNTLPIERGVLRGYLYNTCAANKDGTRSTGNAVRSGFKSVPSVGTTNMFIRPSDGTKPLAVKNLISSAGTGLLVTDAMGVHTANPISGDFSVGVTGLWIEGGTIHRPVKEAVISGNILTFFRSIIACGDDLRFFGKKGSPSLLVGDVDISG